MISTFEHASSFNGDLSTWNTSRVAFFDLTFYDAESFNQTLCWDLSSLKSAYKLFDGSHGSLNKSCSKANTTMTNDNIREAVYQWT